MFELLLELLGDWFAFLPWVRRRRDRRKEWSGTVEAKKTWTLAKQPALLLFRTDRVATLSQPVPPVSPGPSSRVRCPGRRHVDGVRHPRRRHLRAGRRHPCGL